MDWGKTHSRVEVVMKVVTAATLVTGTTLVKVETSVVGATDAVAVDTVVEVPVATREQMLEIRDAGNSDTTEGVGTICRGSSQDKVWIAVPVTYEVMSLVDVDL